MNIISFDKEIVEALKKLLILDNFLIVKSSYLGNRIGFKLTSSWKNKYADYIIYDNPYHFETKLEHLLKIILRCNYISDKFTDRYNLNIGYINLLRNTWFNYDETKNILNIGHKRPFGNSNIINDIRIAFNDENITVDECDNIINEYNNIIKNYLIYEEFEYFLEVSVDNGILQPKYLLTDKYFLI